MTAELKKKTVKVDVFEADVEILKVFLKWIESEKTEEGIQFAFNLMGQMTDRIKELEEQTGDAKYIGKKAENWRQGRLRSVMPFYG